MSYALITGASSGIGFEIAKYFAKDRINLFLISSDDNKLQSVTNCLLQDYEIQVLYKTMDLTKPEAAKDIFNFAQKNNIHIKYLVNNAGYYVYGPFKETNWPMEEKLIYMQCITHTKLTKFFLPEMLQNKTGGILNIASTGSFVPGPNNAIYCASKSFVLSFSRALAEELKETGVKVTTVCPGGTNTNFHKPNKTRRSVLFPVMNPSKVAKIAYNGLMKGKSIVIPGLINKIQVSLVSFVPKSLLPKLTKEMVKY